MTLINPEVIKCPCGKQFIAPLHSSINVSEEPAFKEKLLNGEINKVICPGCGEVIFAGRFLLYHDMEKNFMIWMAPKVNGVSRDDNKNMESERRIQALQKRIDEIKQKKTMPAKEEEGQETHKKTMSLLAHLFEKAKEEKPKREIIYVRGMDALIEKVKEIMG